MKTSFQRKLLLLNFKKLDETIFTKSSIMLGFGESDQEILQVMQDLRDVGCDILTIGQYLQPTKWHNPVTRFVHPDVFAEFKTFATNLGFKHVESGPLVRSTTRRHR